MADIVPSGSLSLCLENLRTLIAATTKWQTWTRSDNATLAKARVHLCDFDLPEDGSETIDKEALQLLRPFVRVDFYNENMQQRAWHATKNSETSFQDGGVLVMDVVDDVGDDLTEKMGQAKLQFLNDVGGLIDEMLAKTPDGGYLTIHNITARDPERVSQVAEHFQGDFWTMRLLIEWGI